MEKHKVILIAGLTNGKIVYDYFKKNKYVDLLLTITYPDTIIKPRHVLFPDDEKILKTEHANQFIGEIKEKKPDFIFVAGWSELLLNELIVIPSKGTIGFHPSKLPHDRGRSVLAWQLEEGYEETALTMFYYNDMPDCGDIIAAEKIKIEKNDYIEDLLNKVDKATYNLLKAYFPLLRTGKAPRIKQELSEGNVRRLRTDRDSMIDWNNNSVNIYNKIRAISKPYPGAIGHIGGRKYKIWRAEPLHSFPFGNKLLPGELVAKIYDKSVIVKTKDAFIKINEYSLL